MTVNKVDIGAHELVELVQELPTLPAVIGRINAEMARESLTSASLGTIISEDASLASMVLKLANSAYYGLVKQVDSIERAITVLGMDAVRNLAMGVAVFSLFKKDPTGVMDITGLWHHALGCATVSGRLLRGVGLEDKGFLSGLLHDLGKVIIANILSDETIMVLGMMADTGQRQSVVEREVFGFDHARIGSLLADKWHFPEIYSRAIRFHHDPSRLSEKKSDPETRTVLAAVHVANKMAKLLGLGKSTDPATDQVDPGYWKKLGLDRSTLKTIGAEIEKEFQSMIEMWS